MLRADVVIYGGAAPDETGRVEEIFRSFEVQARVEVAAATRSEVSRLILVSLPTRALFEQLAVGGAASAAGQLWELTRRISHLVPRHCPGLLLLQDTETGIQVVIDPDLPQEALQALRDVDLAAFTFGPMHYDHATATWRSVFDDWAPP